MATVLGAMVFSGDAEAAPTWLPASTISAPGEENLPSDLAVAPDGTVIVVWQRAECEGQAETHQCKNGRARYSVRPPGGSFSPAADMPGQGAFANNEAKPQVAVDAAGNAIAAWIGGTMDGPRVSYSYRPAGGSFGNAKFVSDPFGEGHYFPSLDMAPNGRAVVTFFRLVGGAERAGYAVRPPGGDFGPADTIKGDTGSSLNLPPTVHLDAGGNGLATWARHVGAEGVFIHYATIDAQAAEFSAPTTIENGSNHKVAMAPSGAAVMIWDTYESAQDMRYAFRPPGGGFGPPATIVDPDQPLGPMVAIAPDGSAVAAWRSLILGQSFIRWAAAAPGGPFGSPQPLQPDDHGVVDELKISDQGTALLLWVAGVGVGSQLRASLRSPGGSFGASAPLPGPPQGVRFFSATADFDPAGNAAAAWSGYDSEPAKDHDVPLLAAGLDAVGPRITTLDVPPSARDDRAVALGLAADDVWSPVVATAFDFGDGSGAAGPVATHRFRAGLHTVVGSATDAVGNSSAATAEVRVADVTRPSLRRLRVVPRRFFALRGPVAHASGRRYGARIRFVLSERARVRLSIQRAGRGVRVRVRGRSRCLPRTRRNLRRGHRRCTRFKKVRLLVRRNGRPGRNSVRLSGRFRGRRLRPGRHRVVAVAIDGAGRRSKPARAGFRVRPRR